MLDGLLKPKIDPALDRIADELVHRGVSANGVTAAALALGLIAAGAIAAGATWVGLGFILASRLLDGLDGAVARRTRPTDFGGYIDIVFDFAFYGAIPAAFVALDPDRNALAGAVLILSFYVNGASFLAFSALAAKRGIASSARGRKSIYFTTGLAEATETLAAFTLMCLWPDAFPWIAGLFAAICFYTALARVVEARNRFPDDGSDG